MIRRFAAPFVLACLLAGCGYSPVANGDQGLPATTATGAPSPGPSGSPGSITDNFSDGAKLTLTKLPDGLQFADITVGTGAVATKGMKLTMSYTGWLTSGQKFDSSPTFDVVIGTQQVIPGWDEGIPGMKVGGKRRLVIPPALAYGATGSLPTIPANATLTFVVGLLAVAPGPSPSPSASPTP